MAVDDMVHRQHHRLTAYDEPDSSEWGLGQQAPAQLALEVVDPNHCILGGHRLASFVSTAFAAIILRATGVSRTSRRPAQRVGTLCSTDGSRRKATIDA